MTTKSKTRNYICLNTILAIWSLILLLTVLNLKIDYTITVLDRFYADMAISLLYTLAGICIVYSVVFLNRAIKNENINWTSLYRILKVMGCPTICLILWFILIK
jgi:hypothetical protein